jgi:hypothetical protein
VFYWYSVIAKRCIFPLVIARRAQPDVAIHAAAGSEYQTISAAGAYESPKAPR